MLFIIIPALLTMLFIYAAFSFCIAFYWQAKVIITINGISDFHGAYNPWKARTSQNSPQNNLHRFIAGEIFPELRRKWLRAIIRVAISYFALFLVAIAVKVFAPEYLLE